MSRSPERGSARDELLAAAAALFGERGPAGVSTRQIAARAGVNNGLIHRHFGTKDVLLRQCLERLAEEIAAAGDGGDDEPHDLLRYFAATRERAAYWRLLARALLDGTDVDLLQREFPTVRKLIEFVERQQAQGRFPADVDARVGGAVLVSIGLGWLVFGPFLRRGAGLEGMSADEIVAEAERLLAKLFA